MLEFLSELSGNPQQRTLAGKDALLDTDLLNFERVSLADDSDDLDSISLGNSTVCTAADNKHLAELEAQLAELRSTVSILTSALQQRPGGTQSGHSPSPPPDPAKNGSIPPVVKNVPPPPPLPVKTTSVPVAPPLPISKTAVLVDKPTVQAKDADEEKENLLKQANPLESTGGDLMSALTAALKKRRKMMGSGVSTSKFDELEKPKVAPNSTGDHLLCAMREKVPPPQLNDSHDSDWFERDDEDWH
ncbi:hypothetical protein M3Y94_00992700 [Aphelenchoides besseyi]|nr:hypothetical protein M3Y94_00992700 [Aphelenchoides besseyi]KAI6221161.1 hypothetical protein M3Y95_01011400 [Aphelenchoides besseyi]